MDNTCSFFQHGITYLESKPGAGLEYSCLLPRDGSSVKTMILFVNGLILPRSGWEATFEGIIRRCRLEDRACPALLSYDRYGQGQSDSDPSDHGKRDDETHDVADAARDMHEFLAQFNKSHRLPVPEPSQNQIRLILVCSSIGCPIGRLFAQYYPDTVSGMIFLDSNMTNTDFVSIWPDPDAPQFDGSSLPDGVTSDELRRVREKYRQIFHPSVPNKERLNRTTLMNLLPFADSPRLHGSGGGPFITVVGHDGDVFAPVNKRTFNTPEPLIRNYIDPVWHRYNQGLAKLTSAERSKGPIIATGCSHFIQRDDADFVVGQVVDMLDQVENFSGGREQS